MKKNVVKTYKVYVDWYIMPGHKTLFTLILF